MTWGTLEQTPDVLCAIMAHSPVSRSDLSFDAWVAAARKHGHAIKVDLKSPRAMEQVSGAHSNRLVTGMFNLSRFATFNLLEF